MDFSRILTAAAISRRSYWIPSGLRSQAAKSPVSTVMGDRTGSPGCCSFILFLKNLICSNYYDFTIPFIVWGYYGAPWNKPLLPTYRNFRLRGVTFDRYLGRMAPTDCRSSGQLESRLLKLSGRTAYFLCVLSLVAQKVSC